MTVRLIVLDLTQDLRWWRLLGGAAVSGLAFERAREPGDAKELLGRGEGGALLLGLDQAGEAAGLDIAADLCRSCDAPVVVASGCLSEDRLLELHTAGVADFVLGEATAEEVEARLLISIDRRSTLRTLHHGSAAFRRLFESAVSPMAVAEANGRVVDANPRFVDLLGYTLQEIRQLDVLAITHPDDAASIDVFAELVRGERDTYRLRKRYLDKAGGVVWADVHVTRVVEPARGEVRLLASLQNVTPEVESHRALDRLRGRYHALFEQIPSALLVVDLDGERFVEVNRAAEALFGFTREELMGLTLADLWVPVSEARGGETRAAIERVLRSEQPVHRMRQQLRRKDGGSVATEVTITTLDDLDADARLVVIHDVSAPQMLEQALEKARQGLGQDTTALTLAHDLGNIATVVVGECERLATVAPPGTEAQRHVGEVRDAAERILRLIRDYLDRARGGREPRPLDLGEATSRTMELVQALVGGGVEVVLDLCDEPLPIWFDPVELSQILLNLAANARDAMGGRGRLTVATRRLSSGPAAPELARLSVADTGIGIPAQLLGSIFEPYFSTKPAGAGTGLGLAGVRRLLRRKGGQIEVESEERRGSTFHVDLPLDATQTPAGTAPPRAERGRATVLLVDDDEAVCTVVAEMLEPRGFRVLSATSSEQALEVAAHYHGGVDLLLVDATLRGLPTPQLVERLQRDRPELAVVVMSGYLDGVLLARGIVGRETPFLSKPFHADELLALVDGALSAAAG